MRLSRFWTLGIAAVAAVLLTSPADAGGSKQRNEQLQIALQQLQVALTEKGDTDKSVSLGGLPDLVAGECTAGSAGAQLGGGGWGGSVAFSKGDVCGPARLADALAKLGYPEAAVNILARHRFFAPVMTNMGIDVDKAEPADVIAALEQLKVDAAAKRADIQGRDPSAKVAKLTAAVAALQEALEAADDAEETVAAAKPAPSCDNWDYYPNGAHVSGGHVPCPYEKGAKICKKGTC